MPQPGFVLGHNFWMGSIEGCEAVQQPPPLTISNRFERFMHNDLWSATAPFDIGYRMVYAEHRSPFQMQVEFALQAVWDFVFLSIFHHHLLFHFLRMNM